MTACHSFTGLRDPTLFLLHKVRGGVTKDMSHKTKKSKPKTAGGGLSSRILNWFCSSHMFGTNSILPDPSRSPQLKGCEKILKASPRSLSSTNSLRRFPLTHTFLSEFPVLQWNRKRLIIFCFFVPFSRILFSPTLIQGREATSFKPTIDLLSGQAV